MLQKAAFKREDAVRALQSTSAQFAASCDAASCRHSWPWNLMGEGVWWLKRLLASSAAVFWWSECTAMLWPLRAPLAAKQLCLLFFVLSRVARANLSLFAYSSFCLASSVHSATEGALVSQLAWTNSDSQFCLAQSPRALCTLNL